MKSSAFTFRSAILTAILITAVTSAFASSTQAALSRPAHGNDATPALRFNSTKSHVEVNSPAWPVPVPPAQNIAVNSPAWPVPVPPAQNIAVNSPAWPVPVPPANGIDATLTNG